MKKITTALLAGFAAVLFSAKPGWSVDNQTIDIVMSIQSLDVTAVKVYDAVSAVAGASKVLTGRAVFTNAGNGPQDFSVRIASTSGTWTPYTGASSVPQSQYRLRAIWAVYNATVAASSFDDDDILSGSNQLSSATKFFSGTGSASDVGTAASNGGYSVPISGVGDPQRHLFFRFDAGASGTTGTATAFVNVTATATP